MPQYEEGLYNCRIESQQLSRNNNTGNYQVVIGFAPEMRQDDAGEWHDMPVTSEPRRLYLALTERSAQITADRLATLGLFVERWSQVDEGAADCVSIVGACVPLRCRIEMYQGQPKERWDVNAGPSAVESVDESQAAEVDALFGDALAGMADKAAKSGAAPVEKSPSRKPRARSAAKRAGDDPDAAGDGDAEAKDDLPF